MARLGGLSRPTVYAGRAGAGRSRPTRAGASAARAAGPSGWSSATRACWRRWTSWSTPTPAGTPRSRCAGPASPPASWPRRLPRKGHPVSDDTVGRLLQASRATRLQRTLKTVEGAQHPDRDAQFRYLNEQARQHLAAGQPVVSVDTKKKELVGRYANGGREWQPAGEPERVDVHDFPDPELGKAIPYGVYDLGANAGWVAVGTDHDTAAFAVATLRRWWEQVGRALYPDGDPAAGHRRRRRVQRLPGPGVEDRAGPASRPRPALRSPCATSRQGPPSGTRSSIGCSATSR